MLGRSVGLSEDQLSHLLNEDPPEGVYTEKEAALVGYARVSSETIAIDDELYGEISSHYEREALMEIWALVGVANMINRFHATFHTDVDKEVLDAVEAGNAEFGSCPLPGPAATRGGRRATKTERRELT